MNKPDLTAVVNLRKALHQNPELSGFEFETARRIKDFIKENDPSQIIEDIGVQA